MPRQGARTCTALYLANLICNSSSAVNKVVGDLSVVSDPKFGGGSLKTKGSTLDSGGAAKDFGIVANEETLQVVSADDASIQGGHDSGTAGAGGSVSILAGSGISVDRGSGGRVSIEGGASSGLAAHGGAGLGGSVHVAGGAAEDGTGGEAIVSGGRSRTYVGGRLLLRSGQGGVQSGDALLQSGE